LETRDLETLCAVEFREVKPPRGEADAVTVEIRAVKTVEPGRLPRFMAFRGDQPPYLADECKGLVDRGAILKAKRDDTGTIRERRSNDMGMMTQTKHVSARLPPFPALIVMEAAEPERPKDLSIVCMGAVEIAHRDLDIFDDRAISNTHEVSPHWHGAPCIALQTTRWGRWCISHSTPTVTETRNAKHDDGRMIGG
jgi:hypothetical protein